MNLSNSEQSHQLALQHLVGGVNSPVRAFNSVGGNPITAKSGKGAYIFDLDDNKYIDYIGSYGPLILGHAHPVINQAIIDTVFTGTTFGTTSQGEIVLAQLVKDAFPAIDKVRFVNSGTEAIMSALRLARAFTNKNKIIKFAGCYHGHSDNLLAQAGSGLATLSLPDSSGVPAAVVQDTLIAEYNNLDSVRQLFELYPDEVAAVIIEPVGGNMGVVSPQSGFLSTLKELCNNNNTLLILDEVMTGFRYHFGGAQAVYNIEADITCLGKIIGGGLPVGAYGARAEIMNMVAPLGPVYQAGTLSGNPLSMASGIALLSLLKENPDWYTSVLKFTSDLKDGFLEISNRKGVAVQVNVHGSMICPFFNEGPVNNYNDAKKSDTNRFKSFFWGLVENGIFIPPSQYEAWFVSMLHSDTELDLTLTAFEKAVSN